eukprot:1963686-Rhodomonas_salina.1
MSALGPGVALAAADRVTIVELRRGASARARARGGGGGGSGAALRARAGQDPLARTSHGSETS